MSNFMPCPQCGTPDPTRVSFSWWGGAIGPRILNHVKCSNCKTKYNGKSGGSNTTGILIYSLVVFVLAFIVVFGFFFAKALFELS